MTDLGTPVDAITTSLNQLRHLMAADDVDGARRLFYTGDLDWLSERLPAEDLRAMRTKVNSGDLQWLRDRFLAADIAWMHDVVASGDLDALRTAARIGGLGWLQALIPAGDYRQLGRRLTDGDVPWLRSRVARWDLPRVLSPGVVAEGTAGGLSAPAPAPTREATATPASGAAGPAVVVAGGNGNGAPARAAEAPVPLSSTVLQPPGAEDPPSTLERLSLARRRFAWVGWVAIAALAVFAWTRLGNRDDRPTLDTTAPSVATTVAPRITGAGPATTLTPATTVAAATTAPATTVAPATTAPPTTSAPPTTAAALPATRSVFFAYNSSSLPPEAAAVIAEVVADTQRLPDVKVQFVGVTDGRGNATANRTLALKRAQVVLDAVKAAGYAGPTETTFGGIDAAASADKARRVDIVFVRV